MDDLDAIPSISTGVVGSRFVSQGDLETAKARRDEQWKAAYARLGQEPPPQPAEDVFDGRSLAEKLAANRAAKQEEWEERNKLGNQFRALEEDEVLFLDSIMEKQREEERVRKEMDGKELKGFREAVAARENEANKPPVIGAGPAAAPAPAKPKAAPAAAAPKATKKSLKGVIVKKKPKANAASPTTPASDKNGKDKELPVKTTAASPSSADKDYGGAERQAKRRKVSDT